LYLFLNF